MDVLNGVAMCIEPGLKKSNALIGSKPHPSTTKHIEQNEKSPANKRNTFASHEASWEINKNATKTQLNVAQILFLVHHQPYPSCLFHFFLYLDFETGPPSKSEQVI
jgi:hypothetical protein